MFVQSLVLVGFLVFAFAEDGRLGGTDAIITDYPYQTSLAYKGSHICGATILTKKLAVTTASCVSSSYLPFKYKIRSGSTSSTNGGYLNQVKIIIPHPLYNQTSKDNDIAVIQIIGLFNIGSPGVGSINVTVIEPPIALPAKLAGWGASSPGGPASDTLQTVTLNTYPRKKCVANLGDGVLRPSMMCAMASGKNFCDYDKGNALVAKVAGFNVVVGLASWQVNGCTDTIGIYTNVGSPVILGFVAAAVSQLG